MILYEKEIKKDLFSRVSDLTELNNIKESSILISIDFWLSNKDEIINSKFNIGIEVNSDQSIELIQNDLKYFKLIQFHFASFKDGRPFSYAKKLKTLYKFSSEIRASGYVLPDQYVFLRRCGFDSINIEEKDLKTWLQFLEMDEGIYYQP